MALEMEKIEGVIPLELPGGQGGVPKMIHAKIKVNCGGEFVIEFQDYHLAQVIMDEARTSNLVGMGFYYSSSRPSV